MTTMISEVYDALREIGVTEDKARKVAEVMATNEPQFAAIRADLRVLKWQITALFGIVTLIGAPSVWLLVRVATKVGALG